VNHGRALRVRSSNLHHLAAVAPSLPLKNAVLIYNPVAGGKPARREERMRQVVTTLEAVGIAARLTPTSAPGTARALARTAAEEGVSLILACGGDGTVNEVINGMTPSGATLGILPGGTANIFARELRMPLDPLHAARAFSRWTPRRIALGRATWVDDAKNPQAAASRYFLSLAGVGLDAYVVHKLSRSVAGSLGVVAYGWEALRQVFRYPFPAIACQTEDGELRATFVVVQRTERFAGWLHLAPGASVFKDRFTLCAFTSPRRWRYFRYAFAIATRRHSRLRDVEMVETCKVKCSAADSTTPVYFELDGELAGTAPVTFELVPDAISVLVP
jgi:YegS/Rv2252/BmrU family lipid kinase